jgi:RimJ/RimL family protein N-acetyltransferase
MILSQLAAHQNLNGNFRKLLPAESLVFRDHLLRLDADSRRLRFASTVPDEYIAAYAMKAADAGSLVYGYFDNGHLRAAGELKRASAFWGRSAEAAFSVESGYTNHGLASELMGLIIRSARNRGVRHLILSCLAENSPMQAIARKYAKDLQIDHGEVVADIIPSRADYMSVAEEILDDRFVLYLAALDHYARLSPQAA